MSDVGKRTTMRRLSQFRDRWSSYGGQSGVTWLSDRLSAAELAEIELFAGLDEATLERISPDVSLARWREGAVVFEEGSYIDIAFYVLEGEVEVGLGQRREGGAAPAPIFDARRSGAFDSRRVDELGRGPAGEAGRSEPHEPPGKTIAFLATMDFDIAPGEGVRLGPGELFGEIGVMSGWPQSVTARTATECLLVQIRVPALRLLRLRSAELKERLDQLYRERSLFSQLRRTPLFRHCDEEQLERLADAVELVSCSRNEAIVAQGAPADALFLVRSGFVRLRQRVGDGEMVVSYLSKGMTFGEVELLVDGIDLWEASAESVEHAELVRIPLEAVEELVAGSPEIERHLWATATARIREMGYTRRDVSHAELTELALDRGLVQGSSMLLIDLDRCTRCDDCVRACAATHGGRPRFVREGSKVGSLMVARSCYHCRDPVCLVGCPTGAIQRAGVADVVAIDDAICIGCSTCANNCPYDAIVMHDTGERWPDDMLPASLRGEAWLLASKCDLCYDTGHDPACVSNCPQGCAYRIGSVDELHELIGHDEGIDER